MFSGFFYKDCAYYFYSNPAVADEQPSAWAHLLSRYQSGGFVDYAALKKNPEDLKAAFDSFALISEPEYQQYDQNEKIAYWINLYNLLAIQLVVNHYPIQAGLTWKRIAYPKESIQQIQNVWKVPVIKVGGTERSLDDIENKILRGKFQEPRIHFALVCASLGCPVLREEPYNALHLDEQLDDQVRRFLADEKKAKYDKVKNIYYLSPIFKWFENDFDEAGGIFQFINQYRKQPVSEKTSIIWLDYDWQLNNIKKTPVRHA